MKYAIKIIILSTFLFLLTGCYDYREVNSINIVTGMGIDYQDNEFIVTLEVLNNTGDKTSTKIDTTLITSNGDSITAAIENASNKMDKVPNYSHLKVLIITNNALENKWFSIMDYYLRNTDFRENFYLVTTKNKPQDILNTKNDTTKVTSIIITNYLENQSYNAINKKFEDYASDYVTFNKDLLFTRIDIINNRIELNGGTIYKNNKTYNLDNNDLQTYNLFNKNNKRIVLNKYYDDKVFSVLIKKSNLKIDINNSTIIIYGSLNAEILNNEDNIDIISLKKIDELNEDFKDLIIDNIKNLINIIKTYDTDILGIDNMYFQKNRKRINNYWLNQDIEIDIDFNIDKKGLIYEVFYEK